MMNEIYKDMKPHTRILLWLISFVSLTISAYMVILVLEFIGANNVGISYNPLPAVIYIVTGLFFSLAGSAAAQRLMRGRTHD